MVHCWSNLQSSNFLCRFQQDNDNAKLKLWIHNKADILNIFVANLTPEMFKKTLHSSWNAMQLLREARCRDGPSRHRHCFIAPSCIAPSGFISKSMKLWSDSFIQPYTIEMPLWMICMSYIRTWTVCRGCTGVRFRCWSDTLFTVILRCRICTCSSACLGSGWRCSEIFASQWACAIASPSSPLSIDCKWGVHWTSV